MSESNGHITKQDLLDMEGRLHKALHGEIESLRADVHRDIEGVETKLLTEFWKWGRASEQKMRRVEFSDATTVERLSILEERIFTLERRVAGSKE
jgi:hypothetical protein